MELDRLRGFVPFTGRRNKENVQEAYWFITRQLSNYAFEVACTLSWNDSSTFLIKQNHWLLFRSRISGSRIFSPSWQHRVGNHPVALFLKGSEHCAFFLFAEVFHAAVPVLNWWFQFSPFTTQKRKIIVYKQKRTATNECALKRTTMTTTKSKWFVS